MLLALSSSARPRYKRDVHRSIAMPFGALLQFRYDKKHVSPEVRSLFTAKTIVGQTCLLAYNEPPRDGRARVVPTRMASISHVEETGSSYNVDLELGNFAAAAEAKGFESWLNKKVGESLPSYKAGTPVDGFSLMELGADEDVQTRLAQGSDAKAWESMVAPVATCPGFAADDYFLRVEGLVASGTGDLAPREGARYSLKPATGYVVRIHQFHPTKAPKDAKLLLASNNESLQFLTGTSLELDSRYDFKRVHLQTARPKRTVRGFIALTRVNAGRQELDFELPFQVKGSVLRRSVLGLFVGALFALTQLGTIWPNSELSGSDKILACIIAVASSVVAAQFIVHGLSSDGS